MPKQTTESRFAVVAHRGYSAAAGENSIRALTLAAEAGASHVEIDVRRSRDGHLVCFHDKDLQRLAGVRSHVDTLSLMKLQQLTATAGCELVTLRQILAVMPGELGLMLDIKLTDAQVLGEIGAAINATAYRGELVAGLRDPRLLVACHAQLPTATPLGLGSDTKATRRFVEEGITMVRLWQRDALAETLARLHAQSVSVWVTVGGPGTTHAVGDIDPHTLSTLMEAGVDGVLVNDPLPALALLRRRAERY